MKFSLKGITQGRKEKSDRNPLLILRYVLKNALDFNGSVHDKTVLGMVLKNHPEFRDDVPKVLKEINSAIKEIKKMPVEEIRKRLQQEAPELLKEEGRKKVDEGPLKELPNATKGNVV